MESVLFYSDMDPSDNSIVKNKTSKYICTYDSGFFMFNKSNSYAFPCFQLHTRTETKAESVLSDILTLPLVAIPCPYI